MLDREKHADMIEQMRRTELSREELKSKFGLMRGRLSLLQTIVKSLPQLQSGPTIV